MQQLLLLLTVLIFTNFATKWNKLDKYHFDMYQKEFEKTYTYHERGFRKTIFENNLKSILKHNNDPTKIRKEEVNQFTDRTPEELKAYLGKRSSPVRNFIKSHNKRDDRPDITHLSSNVDWRDRGVITPVKNQGRCGSCYAFSAAQSVESYIALKTGNLDVLSEQQILDCTPNIYHCGGSGGCGGGTEELAFTQIIKMGGLSSEWTYPYDSYFGQDFTCNQTRFKPIAKISDYVNLPLNDYDSMVHHITEHGPLSISVDASNWFKYSEGIFNGCNQVNPDLNHAVQLVGIGNSTTNGEYWIVRNSWGTSWGESGYIFIQKSSKVTCGIDITPQNGNLCEGNNTPITVCGTCGILYSGVYPVV